MIDLECFDHTTPYVACVAVTIEKHSNHASNDMVRQFQNPWLSLTNRTSPISVLSHASHLPNLKRLLRRHSLTAGKLVMEEPLLPAENFVRSSRVKHMSLASGKDRSPKEDSHSTTPSPWHLDHRPQLCSRHV